MSKKAKVLKAKWHEISAKAWQDLPSLVPVGEMPSFPLAKAVDMPVDRLPEDDRFARGSLALRLHQVSVRGSAPFTPEIETIRCDDERVRVCLRFGETILSGEHTLEGTQIWESGIDGAGNGLSFDDQGRVRRLGGADDTDKHPTWTATARAQRDWLQDQGGQNGQNLLLSYSNNRAAFTDVLTQPKGIVFQLFWKRPLVGEMAGDTHTAVSTNQGVVNSSTKLYDGSTYNVNASNLHFTMLTALRNFANTCEDGSPDPNCPYQKAIQATTSFANGLVTTYQKGDSSVQSLHDLPAQTADAVKGTVQTASAPPQLTLEQAHRYLNGEDIGGKHADGTTWTMRLSEEDRALLRDLRAQNELLMERLNAVKPRVLAGGKLSGNLGEFRLVLDFEIVDGDLVPRGSRAELDSFEVDLEDSDWPEEIADIAARELTKARFIRSLLHDRIADALERDLARQTAAVLIEAARS